MRRLGLLACVLMMLVLASCENASTVQQPEIEMGSTSFISYTTWNIKAGQSILFVDSATQGTIHDLLTGEEGNYEEQPGAPDVFNNPRGLFFHPGDQQMITFPTAGKYTITCTIHDAMLVDVNVQ